MRVIELFPGQGWFRNVLAPYLEKQGQLYLAVGTTRVEFKLEGRGFNKEKITVDVQGFTFSLRG